MLNAKGERELCYLVQVDGIDELPGYDRVESARVGGWRCIVPKGQFAPGTIGVYFEIDSLVPADNPAFAFMEKRNYKVKSQKMCKSISQGLLMHPMDFGWVTDEVSGVIKNGNKIYTLDNESKFLTAELGVKYADAADNVRKAPSMDKYKRMAQRMGKKASKRRRAQWLRRMCFWLKSKNSHISQIPDGFQVYP